LLEGGFRLFRGENAGNTGDAEFDIGSWISVVGNIESNGRVNAGLGSAGRFGMFGETLGILGSDVVSKVPNCDVEGRGYSVADRRGCESNDDVRFGRYRLAGALSKRGEMDRGGERIWLSLIRFGGDDIAVEALLRLAVPFI
jgi:hypothetical protein